MNGSTSGEGREQQREDLYSDADALLQAFGNTDICVFMYYPREKRIDIPEKTCNKYFCKAEYDNMPYSFADDFVLDDDREAFCDMYYKIDGGASTATARFHSKDMSACCRVTLTALHGKDDEPVEKVMGIVENKNETRPAEVLGIIEDISEWDRDKRLISKIQSQLADATEDEELNEAMNVISAAISSQYYALYHIWLEDRTYICFQEQLPGIIKLIGEKGAYEPAWDTYINNYIEAEDRPAMRKFADIETLAQRLKEHSTIVCEYRRKEVGWTRGQFIAARHDENGNVANAVYTVTDINAEKTMEAARHKAVYESHHDPLTGVYNRKGLEQILADPELEDAPIGFAIVDIDYFKTVNDSFGHEAGDQVIKEVAGLLDDMFRTGDSVFRLGGDEFAVLLKNCTPAAWDTLCEKQRRIHAALNGTFDNNGVTLSVGIAFSKGGYDKNIYLLADEMLYEAKARGRAGCASIDTATEQRRYWRDNAISCKAQNVLASNNTGTYRVEFPLDGKSQPRLMCDDTTKELFGLPKEATPEESYRIWHSSIDPSYLDTLKETHRSISQGIQAECTYKWHHPEQGDILVRTGGSAQEADGMQVLYGYHHSMENTRIVERKDDRRLIIDAMGGIYFCSYYIDLENDSFLTVKSAPGEKYMDFEESKAEDARRQFLSMMVCEEHRDRMDEFTNPETLETRLKNEVHLDCEYLSCTDKGWCRATFFPVKHNADGKLTHALFVITSLDARKAKEARAKEESRKSIDALYDNVPGGIVMYEWDGQQLKTLHISAYYEKEYGYTLNNDADGTCKPDFERVHPDDLPGYQAAILEALTETHELHYDYRVWNRNENRYLWTHIDATAAPQPDGTVLVYALYTDVTERRAVVKDYEDRVESVLRLVEDSIVIGRCNLTENSVEYFKAADEMQRFTKGVHCFDERFANAAECVVGEKAREEYLRTFNREHLLQLAEQGETQVRMEYLLQIPNDRTMWLETGISMVKNPVTGEITAISYSKNVQDARLSSLLLKSTLGKECLKTMVVLADSGDFYTLDRNDDTAGVCQHGFWESIDAAMGPVIDERAKSESGLFDKETLLAQLERNGEFSYSFNSNYYGTERRLRIGFIYLNKSQGLLLVSLRDITDAALMDRLRHDNEHDQLTDLYNRKTLFRACKRLLAEHPDDTFAMVHVDMRHFRLYNSFFGDAAGDKLLCDVADMLRRIDADYDYWAYGRIEADVFCAFFPFDREKYAEHIMEAFEQLKNYRADFLIEPVLGVYLVEDRTLSIEAMFTRATLAAKSVQQGTELATAFYDESLEKRLNEDQQVISDMQTAIDEEQFEVYLQPKYSLRTNKPVGAEALVRWIHPKKGMISPGKFIPVFEGNGFITTLDRYMWEHVCKLLRKWLDEGRQITPVSVNVSRLSMFGMSTVDFLKDLVKRYRIDPKYLELELTESAYIDDPEEMKSQLLALRDAGFKVLLDDFGSGYSSLNTLRELPVDVLKLDMKFLPVESHNIRGGLVLSSIVRMSKLLNLTVIAEGVELQEHADFLKGIGCEYVQGFLFAKPMPVADYENLLESSDEPTTNVNQPTMGHIGRIIAETGTGTYAMGTVIPLPLACLEYQNGKFAFLRVNPEFFEEFDLSEDLEPVSAVFENRLTQDSYETLATAFEESARTGKKLQVPVLWNAADGTQRTYLCRIAYEGNIGATASLVVAFTNITEVL